jgi:DNA-binding NarL/FixJ family response regulator
MTEQTGLTVNVLTGEEVVAPLTKEELDFIELIKVSIATQQSEQDAKLAARQSALAKLAALGLTEEEIEAL